MSWFSKLFKKKHTKKIKPTPTPSSGNPLKISVKSPNIDTNSINLDYKTFRSSLKKLLVFEGVYSNDAYDSGGQTKYGIIKSEARDHGYSGSMRDMPMSIAEDIYYNKYWLRMKLDQVSKINPKIANEMFDTGVNMGISRAVKALQKSLNILNRIHRLYPNMPEDGKIGSNTLIYLSKLPKKDHKFLLKLMNIIQGSYYIKFIENRETQEVFVRGWIKRVSLEDS